jgi:hypothetical protein
MKRHQPKHKRTKPVLNGIDSRLDLNGVRLAVIAMRPGCMVMREHYIHGRKGSAALGRSFRALELLFKELVHDGVLSREFDQADPDRFGSSGDFRHDHHWQPKRWYRRGTRKPMELSPDCPPPTDG